MKISRFGQRLHFLPVCFPMGIQDKRESKFVQRFVSSLLWKQTLDHEQRGNMSRVGSRSVLATTLDAAPNQPHLNLTDLLR